MTYAEHRATVDAEGAFRSWLRVKVPALGQRVFFGIPAEVSYPFATVALVGGTPQQPRLSVQCWGATKSSAAGIAQSVADAVEELGTEALDADVTAHGGSVDLMLWQPAPPEGKPRYIVDVTISVSAT